MIALIDFDSLLYESVYKIVSYRQMKEAISNYGKETAKQWLLEEIYHEGVNRAENQLLKMQNYLNDIFFEEIDSYELYITTCSKSFRKQIGHEYKANRKPNKYVFLLREHYRNNGALNSEVYEADDLIADRAKELGKGNFIVVSIDKDLKQIPGYYWSYYKVKSKDHEGNLIINDYGFPESEYRQKTVTYITPKESRDIFWKQVLQGDPGDNIKGLHRVGPKTAEKIISVDKNPFIRTAREYITRNQKDDFWFTYHLIKLGSRDIELIKINRN